MRIANSPVTSPIVLNAPAARASEAPAEVVAQAPRDTVERSQVGRSEVQAGVSTMIGGAVAGAVLAAGTSFLISGTPLLGSAQLACTGAVAGAIGGALTRALGMTEVANGMQTVGEWSQLKWKSNGLPTTPKELGSALQQGGDKLADWGNSAPVGTTPGMTRFVQGAKLGILQFGIPAGAAILGSLASPAVGWAGAIFTGAVVAEKVMKTGPAVTNLMAGGLFGAVVAGACMNSGWIAGGVAAGLGGLAFGLAAIPQRN